MQGSRLTPSNSQLPPGLRHGHNGHFICSRYADSAIDRDYHAVHICAGSRREIDGDPRHVRRRTDAPEWALCFNLFLKGLQQPPGHLAFERPGSDGIDADAARTELHGEHSCQMVDCGFAWSVGVVFNSGDLRPSIEPILMTLAGSPGRADF